jgi:Mg/Co/Ni transporter MgtE
MITKEQIERLRGNKDFVEFLDYIKESRENDIAALMNAETDKLHQRAGAIATNQAVLDLFDYATIKRYWE